MFAISVLRFYNFAPLKKSQRTIQKYASKIRNARFVRSLTCAKIFKVTKKTLKTSRNNICIFYLQVIALRVKRNNDWKTWTYERYLREVQLAARGKTFLPIFIKNIYFFNIYLFLGFIHLGLARHHSVAIIGANSPEWVISDLAAIFAG